MINFGDKGIFMKLILLKRKLSSVSILKMEKSGADSLSIDDKGTLRDFSVVVMCL